MNKREKGGFIIHIKHQAGITHHPHDQVLLDYHQNQNPYHSQSTPPSKFHNCQISLKIISYNNGKKTTRKHRNNLKQKNKNTYI